MTDELMLRLQNCYNLLEDEGHYTKANTVHLAIDRINALEARVEMFRKTNRRLNRRVQLLEGWWQRKVERANQWRHVAMQQWCDDRKDQPLNIKSIEEAAYQRGYEDGHDARFIIPTRRANARKKGDKP